jgi:hypothetical protein
MATSEDGKIVLGITKVLLPVKKNQMLDVAVVSEGPFWATIGHHST